MAKGATMSEPIRRDLPPTILPNLTYPAHYLADDFPMIEGKDFDDLVADIKDKGILNPIVLYDDGSGLKILDGRNRYRAAKTAGVTFTVKDYKTFTGTLEEAEAFVNSINNKRRHMNSMAIQAYLGKVIQRYPKLTNREIERMTGHSHVTVGKVKDKLVNPDKINPTTLKEFEGFKRKFEKWPEYLQSQFVRYYENEIRGILGL
jgi:hypothetical protein